MMRSSGVFRRGMAAAVFLLVLTATAFSQQYQILQARYGTAQNNIDVTQRLRELASRDVTFRMGNSTFGTDPAPGQVKTLRIYARDNSGRERMFEYREGSTIDGSQFSGWNNGNWGNGGWNGGWWSGSDDAGQYQILQARYGTARNNVDVTQRLQDLASRDVTFRMGNSTFGIDPDPGEVKTLRIYARDNRGSERMFEYREGSTVDGSQFSSWNSGNWGNGGWNGGWNGGSGGGGYDQGQYQILQARYGTANHNVDVTQRLRELATRDVTFRMGNSTFGIDPDPGQVKTLRIFAQDNRGSERMFEYREGSTIDGSQFSGWSGGNWGNGGWNGGWNGGYGGGRNDQGQYQILQARYGTARRNIDVTQRLRELATQDTTFRMGNSTFGTDPDPGHEKTLRIYARDSRGSERMFEYREGSTVDGSQFTGWRGGNWGRDRWNGGWNGGRRGGRDRDDEDDNYNNGRNPYGRLSIVRATYGAGGRNVDVTDRLRGLIRGDRLEVRVGNSAFDNDPAPGKRKSLTITYTVNGRQQQRQVREGDVLNIP